jgi:ribosome-binding factor A
MASRNLARRDAEQLVSIRTQRLEELIREELNFLFDTEVTDPRLEGTHVTRVVLTPDGARANVFFARDELSPGGDDHRLLGRAIGFLRFRLGHTLDLKRTPELRFFPDSASVSLHFFDRSDD